MSTSNIKFHMILTANLFENTFYHNLLKHMFFPKNIANYKNSQSNFVFTQNTKICQKYSPFEIFPLLQRNKRYMYIKLPLQKWISLKPGLLAQSKN